MKSRSFSALKVKVGLWEKSADNENDIVVKFYFNRRRFLWEILHNQRKYKMEISLDHVSAFKALFNEETTNLFIRLEKSPAFLEEDNPISQKQTTWTTIDDFTHGEAKKLRWHALTFKKEVFGKNQYEQIIYSKSTLHLKSCGPFPSTNSLFFEGFSSEVPELNPHCLPNQTHGNSASEVQQQAVVVPPSYQIPSAIANVHRSSPIARLNSSVQYMQDHASVKAMPTISASNFQPNYASAEASSFFYGDHPIGGNRVGVLPIVSQIEEQPSWAPSTPVPNLYSQMHNVDPQAQFHGEMDQEQEGVQNSSEANGVCNPTEAMHGLAGRGNREITLDDDEYGVLEQLRSILD